MAGKTRIERDSLGELEVPAEALYGIQTQRAVLNFPISGLVMPRYFLRALGLVKAAAASANASLGHLPPEVVCRRLIGPAPESRLVLGWKPLPALDPALGAFLAEATRKQPEPR